MTTYVAIPNADVAVGAPLDTALMTALRDNAIAVGENDDTVPDDARISLELGSAAPSSVNSVTFNGLDLSKYRYLTLIIHNIEGNNSGANLEVGPSGSEAAITSGSPASTTANDSNAYIWIDLDQGVCFGQWRAQVVVPAVTGITNATTSIDIQLSASAQFVQGSGGGTIKLYGHK